MAVDPAIIAEITQKFTGSWKEVRNENLDAFLQDVGEWRNIMCNLLEIF